MPAMDQALKKLIFVSIYRQPIFYQFQHGHNCAKAIGTPRLSAYNVNTRGVPFDVKALFRGENCRNYQNELAPFPTSRCL